jgi:hypothetical protein
MPLLKKGAKTLGREALKTGLNIAGDTSAGGLLVLKDIIRPVVNASALACCITITGSIPLLVDY